MPTAALGWAGPQHTQITAAASKNLPPEMAGFEAFSRPMALPSTYPDIWRETDFAEGPRHYFKPDYLPASFDFSRLPTDRMEAFRSPLAGIRPTWIGIAPWSILNLMQSFTSAMKTNDWVWASRCAAALSHYVADVHMPFHCTRNHDGQETGQNGIHMRIESNLTELYFQPDSISPSPPVYLKDPFQSVLKWATDSLLCVPPLLEADRIAAQESGNTQSPAYYQKTWKLAGPILIERISASATDLSSIWYTAWIDAGKPAIPRPLSEIPPYSVFSGVGITPPEPQYPRPAARTAPRSDALFWGALALFVAVAIVAIRRYGK